MYEKRVQKSAILSVHFPTWIVMEFGYARVSTIEQNTEQQETALENAGCDRVFVDHGVSGAAEERPQLERYVVVVTKLDRLGRSLPQIFDIVETIEQLTRAATRWRCGSRHQTGSPSSLPQIFDIVETIEQRSAGLRSLAESEIDTTSAAGKLVFRVFAVVAEFERDRLRERTLEGIARARAAGTHLGRPKTLDAHQITNLRRLREQGESYGSLAKTFKIARSTAREYCKDIVSIEN